MQIVLLLRANRFATTILYLGKRVALVRRRKRNSFREMKVPKAPTIKDVAKRARVATATVSHVLSGRRAVADNLRQRVLKAVDALGYRPNQVAASLRQRQTRSVGIVVPDLTNPFFASLVHHIEELAADSGYQVLLVGSNENAERETERVQALIARRVDGLIVMPTGDKVSVLHNGGPPTVLVDRGFSAVGYDRIACDNLEGGYVGTRHLLDLGHREIAILATSKLANIEERVEGYRRALAEAGVSSNERVIYGGVTIDSCREAMRFELLREKRPTAIFGTAYVATLGAVQAIRAANLSIPEDISLLGFDDSDWMTVLRPYVSTIRQPIQNIAINSWNRLHARLTGDVTGSLHMQLPCTLEVRESTCPPAGRQLEA
jgi:LacI family transcriptional regulator